MFHPENLLSEFTCGPLHLKNRLIAAPIVTGYEYHGDVELLKGRLMDFARDGVSMVTVAAGIVQTKGRPLKQSPVFDETLAQRHQSITSDLHQQGCRAVLQLIHAGPQADVLFPVSSQHQHLPPNEKHAHGASNYVLRKTIEAYAKTARNAIHAGYDGVEVLASGLSLPAVFLSPTINARVDNWGANQLGRFKLSLDIVRAVRKEIGEDKAIGFRFNLMELSPTSFNWDEILRFTQMLRIAGVDYLCADFGGIDARIPGISFDMPDGVWNDAYESLAENTDLSVVFGHRFGPLPAAEALAGKHANTLFELSEELLGDKRYIHKSLGLEASPVTPWIDLQTREPYNDLFRTTPIFSVTNPSDLFIENDRIVPTQNPKKIVVVGAGPAGIYFSLIASRRGHQVTLLEKNDFIGGSLHFLQKIHGSDDISVWIKILENRLNLSTADVKLNTKANINDLLHLNDVNEYVLATGIEPEIVDIPGVDSSNVLTFDEMFEDNLPVGNRVAVVGVNPLALSVCRYLLERTKEKDLAPSAWRDAWGIGDIKEHAGGVLGFIPEIEPSTRLVYLMENQRGQLKKMLKHLPQTWSWKWLLINGLHTFDDINIEGIDNYSVRVSTGDKHTDRFAVRIDHVVLCNYLVGQSDLATKLTLHDKKVHTIGALNSEMNIGNLKNAIQSSIELALKV